MLANEFMVEVAYALPNEQIIIPVKVEAGLTVETAIQHSGILDKFPEIDLGNQAIGIFGKRTRLDATLKPKDRIEIYRPLIADAKTARKNRAATGKANKKGGHI